MPNAHVAAPVRQAMRVRGSVQGVGFRPFVFRLALELSLTGWVLNDAEGVSARSARRADAALARCAPACSSEAPPLARVLRSKSQPQTALRHRRTQAFTIEASRGGAVKTAVPPDTATCADCLAELFDPPTAATATPSSTAPSAGRATRSRAACPMTAR
jgi:hydrogenase maturation protein HypF